MRIKSVDYAKLPRGLFRAAFGNCHQDRVTKHQRLVTEEEKTFASMDNISVIDSPMGLRQLSFLPSPQPTSSACKVIFFIFISKHQIAWQQNLTCSPATSCLLSSLARPSRPSLAVSTSLIMIIMIIMIILVYQMAT